MNDRVAPDRFIYRSSLTIRFDRGSGRSIRIKSQVLTGLGVSVKRNMVSLYFHLRESMPHGASSGETLFINAILRGSPYFTEPHVVEIAIRLKQAGLDEAT